ncbi:MAG: hypothetical protein NZ660_09685 [Oscillatoriaceae bacterium SKYG93]|nr:hypothetical protein [Oscillatoriaceae bacterium SKYG93]MDW8453713.1 hypothetical protein [Oscillatoriaceae cyanobacterium SKYGB_i_bin93]
MTFFKGGVNAIAEINLITYSLRLEHAAKLKVFPNQVLVLFNQFELNWD